MILHSTRQQSTARHALVCHTKDKLHFDLSLQQPSGGGGDFQPPGNCRSCSKQQQRPSTAQRHSAVAGTQAQLKHRLSATVQAAVRLFTETRRHLNAPNAVSGFFSWHRHPVLVVSHTRGSMDSRSRLMLHSAQRAVTGSQAGSDSCTTFAATTTAIMAITYY